MKYFLFILFFLLITAFLWLLDHKIVHRGLPNFSSHRHPQNVRRSPFEKVELSTTTGEIYGGGKSYNYFTQLDSTPTQSQLLKEAIDSLPQGSTVKVISDSIVVEHIPKAI